MFQERSFTISFDGYPYRLFDLSITAPQMAHPVADKVITILDECPWRLGSESTLETHADKEHVGNGIGQVVLSPDAPQVEGFVAGGHRKQAPVLHPCSLQWGAGW